MATFNKNTTFTDAAGSGQTFQYVSSVGDRHTYARYSSDGYYDSTNTISYDEGDKKWRDEHPTDHPSGLYVNTSSSQPTGVTYTTTTTATGTENAEYVHMVNNSGAFMMTFAMAGWSGTSGGGQSGGGGAQTNSADPVITNVAFTKNAADNELTLTFDWDENQGTFNSFTIYKKKSSDGLTVSVNTGVSGTSGSVSLDSSDKAILGSVEDGDKFWIRNDPTYTGQVPDHPLDIVIGSGGIDLPYTHRYIDWSVEMVNGVRSVVGKFYGVDTGQTTDGRLEAFGPSINQYGDFWNHDGTLQTITHVYKSGGNMYKLVRFDILNNADYDYGNKFYTPKSKVFRNFW